MIKYPMLLGPVSKKTIWGGNKLTKEYGKTAEFENIAESWELSVRANEMCSVINGSFEGKTLGEILDIDRNSYVGTNSVKYDRFPLLIKFIDAADKLSIQVHPDNDYSLKNENEFGKTEMWYIIDADEDASLVYGLNDGITEEAFADYVKNGRIEEALKFVKVKPGEVYFIPSGQVHAIGSGILIAEIQQNSDVTYRLYDFNRRQKDGSLRQLHTEKAIDVIKVRDDKEIEELQFSTPAYSSGTLLASCEYFTTEKYSLKDNTVSIFSSDDSFVSLLVVAGTEGVITTDNDSYIIKKGQSWFVPAGFGTFSVSGNVDFIVSRVN